MSSREKCEARLSPIDTFGPTLFFAHNSHNKYIVLNQSSKLTESITNQT